MQSQTPQSGHQLAEVGRSIQLQNYVLQGDYDSLEREFPGTELHGLQPTLNWALIHSVKNTRRSTDYLQRIQMLFAKGASLNAEDDSATPLLLAAQKGDLQLVEWIIEKDVNVHHKDKSGRNCLFYAIASSADNPDVISVLLNKEVKVNERDAAGYTPLLKACEQGYPMTLEVLLKHKADPNDQNPHTGDTGFHLLARCKKKTALKCAELLLNYGALPNKQNKAKKTPVTDATENGNTEILKVYTEALNSKKQSADQVGEEILKAEEKKRLAKPARVPSQYSAEPSKESGEALDERILDPSKHKPKKQENTPKAKLQSTPPMARNPALGFPNGPQIASVATQYSPILTFDTVNEHPLQAERDRLVQINKEKDEKIRNLYMERSRVQDVERSYQKKVSDLEKRLRELNTALDKKEKKIKDLAATLTAKKEKEKKPSTSTASFNVTLLNEEMVYKALTEEIEEFQAIIKAESIKVSDTRKLIIKELRTLISGEFPDYDLAVYGSYAADISLPTSDIDLVIISKERVFNPADVLESITILLEKKLDMFPSIKFLSKASVPVVKLEASPAYQSIKLDITVKDSRHKGQECVEIVKAYLKQYPQLQPLMLTLKYMLKITELNDPYKGGLSSYGLLLMLVAFFQTKSEWPKEVTLGKWFMWAMHFYTKWNPHWTYVYPKPPNIKTSIIDQPVFITLDQYSEVPVIVDPLCQVPPNNVTKSTEEIAKIQDIFFAAVNSAWTDCTCGCHKRKKTLAGGANFFDGRHKMLGRMFAAIQGCHKMHEIVF